MPDRLVGSGDFEELSKAAGEAIGEVARGEHVCLVLPLHWCFVEFLRAGDKRKSDQALAFELEPHLPVSLEQLTCSFRRTSGVYVLGVALPTEPARSLLDSLAAEGVEVSSMTVDVVALLENLDQTIRAVAVADSKRVRAVTITQGAGTACVLPRPQIRSNDVIEAISNQLGRSARLEIRSAEMLLFDLAAAEDVESGNNGAADRAVELLAKSAVRSRLDLCRGPLAASRRWQEPVRVGQYCLATLIVLLIILLAGGHWHHRTLLAQLSTIQDEQSSAYRAVFPGSAPPIGAAARLASERLRLEGLTRSPADQSVDQAPPSALRLLRDAVAALPGDVRIMLQDLRIEGGQLVMHGRTAEHRDAERIVERLATLPQIQTRPPRTSRHADGGVEFSVSAEVTHGK